MAASAAALPALLRGVDPRRVSTGVYMSLVGSGAYGPMPARPSEDLAGLVPSAGLKGTPPAALDARVSPNMSLALLGSALPAGEDEQAEPYIFRSVAAPDVVLATFQQGRFAGSEGGAADVAYALSLDGGFTWRSALIPSLSQASGGAYFRSTDPVSAVDLQGDLFLSTLEARDAAFALDDLVVSRSLDGGATWTNHVAFSTPNAQLFADKDWLAVNDYAGTPHPGRIVATYTGFTSTLGGLSTGTTLFAIVSDDQGTTWSAPSPITPPNGNFQGTQPYFLPDGTLVCVYDAFQSSTSTVFILECRRSLDGGTTWPAAAAVVAPTQIEFDDSVARTGGGLPAVAVARQTGAIFVTWQAVAPSGAPRIFLTQSADKGATWAPAVTVSDNPPDISVFNPAVTVTPDGQTVAVVFYDKRLAPDKLNYVDLFEAQSFDGGATWEPEIRISSYTTDLRLAALSDTGYMVGDYLGIAQALLPTQGALPIWCDTRSGTSQPLASRLALSPVQDYAAWQSVEFTTAELADPAKSGATADLDGDGYPNLAEYALGTDPRTAESGASLATAPAPAGSATGLSVSWTERTTSDFTSQIETSVDGGLTWQAAAASPVAMGTGPFAAATETLAVPSSGANQVRLVVQQTGTGAVAAVPDIVLVHGDSRLINLSTRGNVGTGSSQLIAGFATTGGTKSLLLRAAGPGLAQFDVPTFITNPVLTLQLPGSGTVLASDVNWGDNGAGARVGQAEAQVGAFPFAGGSHDSALLVSLGAGTYTASVTAGPGSSGSTALAEIYDADSPGPPGRLVNVSTRGSVGTGEGVMIAGFVIGGSQPKRVLVRASGPALAGFGVSGTLSDPQFTIYNSAGAAVAANDDWMLARDPSVTVATAAQVGAFTFADASLDAALVVTLAPGPYTVVVSGVNAATGNTLVEVYDAD